MDFSRRLPYLEGDGEDIPEDILKEAESLISEFRAKVLKHHAVPKGCKYIAIDYVNHCLKYNDYIFYNIHYNLLIESIETDDRALSLLIDFCFGNTNYVDRFYNNMDLTIDDLEDVMSVLMYLIGKEIYVLRPNSQTDS